MYILTFTVDRKTAGVTPATPQTAGVRGDNGAARLIFNGADDTCTYRLEIVDGGGGYDITSPLTSAKGTITYDIPAAWTAPGLATVRLVEQKDETVCHFSPVQLFFADREEGIALTQAVPYWQQLLTQTEETLSEAEDVTAKASCAAQTATATTETLKRSAHLADEAIEKAEDALKRCAGVKGVYVGSGEMPPEYNVQIDPTGETDVVSVACGGTGATTAQKARAKLEVPKSTWLADDVDIDTVNETGFYLVKRTNISASKPFGDMEFNILHIDRTGATNTIATQIAIRDDVADPRIKVRRKLSGTWHDWVLITQKADEIHRHDAKDFNVVVISDSDIDTAYKPGWYFINYLVTPGAGSHSNIIMRVDSSADNTFVVQHIYSSHSGLSTLRRQRVSDVWGEWEWENPSMIPDFEYRTTEQYFHDSVFVKRVTYTFTDTIGSNEGVTTLSFSHGISGINKLVRVEGRIPEAKYAFPYISNGGGITVVNAVDATNVKVRIANMTWEPQTFEFDIYYTK